MFQLIGLNKPVGNMGEGKTNKKGTLRIRHMNGGKEGRKAKKRGKWVN